MVEAPQGRQSTPKTRKSREKLEVDSTSLLPAQAPSKRAQHYIELLRDLWLDLHRLPAALIDQELMWTNDEATRFAECAYEICRSRNLLKFLERANEARLIVLVLSIEVTKVQKVMEKQAAKSVKPLSTPPSIRQSAGNDASPHNSPDIPQFVPRARIAQPGT